MYVDRGLKKVLSCPVCINGLKYVDRGLKKVLSCPVCINSLKYVDRGINLPGIHYWFEICRIRSQKGLKLSGLY